jgi:hypothetical protein
MLADGRVENRAGYVAIGMTLEKALETFLRTTQAQLKLAEMTRRII